MLPRFREAGATLLALTPQLPEFIGAELREEKLHFQILSDTGNAVGREYGLTFELPDDMKEIYRSVLEIDVPYYNGDNSWELPMPATFVIDGDRVIRFSGGDPDYTHRAEPADVAAAVESLR